jgi:uncharacterized protein YjiS (DUF1127 family)
MESTMASTPITYRAGLETPAPHGLAASIARKSAAFARAPGASDIRHEIRVLEGQARKQADAAAGPFSLWARFGGVAARSARAIAQELRIRRDTRELMAMSDHMLKDIGLERAEIGSAVRYGRD